MIMENPGRASVPRLVWRVAMLTAVRAGLAAAILLAAAAPALCADEAAFKNAGLDAAAIKLEAQIRHDAGPVTAPAAALRKEADAAFRKRDYRTGMLVLGRLVTAAPDDGGNWLRLARAVRAIKPRDDKEKSFLLERAASAAYIAYERSGGPEGEAESLALLGETLADRREWRPALDAMRLSLVRHESAGLRARYARLRAEHGFRMLDYSVDSDAVSPRVCFQFSEDLAGGRRTDFSPYVAVAGMERPAISADDRQLCVEGLRHGERYAVTLRAGLPSAVHEPLAKTAQFTVFVRDRKPFVRFSGKAYVLPRTGQRGIPVQSVNTKAVEIAVYRVGDRNLVDTVLGYDFQRNMSGYEAERLAQERGTQVWTGVLAVEPKLNTEVVTAFPVTEVLGALKPGVYAMTAAPKERAPNDDGALATQWFVVSDIGITSYSGIDGIDVCIHSLATSEPVATVEVRLMARNNELLSARPTNKDGRVHFPAGLTRGEGGMAPAAIVATLRDGGKEDYAFLSLKTAPFDFTDRGVKGRPAPEGLDAFVYTERGVYRTGETVHVTALLRDVRGVAAAGAPLTLVVSRPDGVEARRGLVADAGLGGRNWDVPIIASAMTGTWRIAAFTDPKRPPVGETSFMVEDYVPDRIEFDLVSDTKAIAPNSPVQMKVDGRFLYGAPASGLALQGAVTIGVAKERPGYAGYVFGLSDEDVTAVRQELDELPATDAKGKAAFPVTLDQVPTTTRLLEAKIAIDLAEAGGRAVERTVTLPVKPAAPMIGVRPAFSARALADGANAGFDVVMVAPDGHRVAQHGLHYELLRIETSYQWYKQNGQWNFEPVKRTQRVGNGVIDTTAEGAARLSLPVHWGRYRLEVSTGDPNGPITSLPFDAGFYAEADADTPDLLETALDKTDYKPGELLDVAVTARTAGRLMVEVFTDRLAASVEQEVQPGIAHVRIPVGQDWGTGAYVVATLRRPLDAPARRMPGRAIGVQWFGIDHAAHTLSLAMDLPTALRPNTALTVPLRVAGLAPGEDARVVVAAVDVGILNLTNYKPPAPDDYYLGQRRLGTEVRDLYGQLIDGMQGVPGTIRSGGDIGAALTGSPPAQAPLALYSGIVKVGADGTAQVSFDIPAFTGTVRVMAVGWSKDRVGKAVGNVVVRDPVVLTATLPRFLRGGDRGAVQLEFDNVEGAPGDYRIAVSGEGGIAVEAGAHTLNLPAKERRRLSIPVSAAGASSGVIDVSVTGPDGFSLERAYTLDVRPATQVLTRRSVRSLASGETLSLSRDLFANFVPGTGRAALSVSLSASLDAAALLDALDRYPFRCSEQVTSRAIAMLYAKDVGGSEPAGERNKAIRDAIASLLARQDSDGSFGLWSVGGNDIWLDAYVTDFLTRARERGFAVPTKAFTQALDRLRNYAAMTPDPAKNGGRELAYTFYVLARNGVAPIGDIRYVADEKLAAFATPIAKAQVASALAMLGDKTRANRVYTAALEALAPAKNEIGRADYGSALRDAAALVTLASEAHAPQQTIDAAITRVDAARALFSATSTQEDAWLVLAASALARERKAISLTVDGDKRQGAFHRRLTDAKQSTPLSITNSGDGTVQAVVSVSGVPVTPEPAAAHGFKVERKFYTLAGEPTDPSNVTQNQRFAVVLTVTEEQPQFGRVVLADYLPAGFEIDNPHLVSSGDTGKLPWISDAAEPVHTEFRDDRFTAAFERTKESPPVFTVAYVVRAVSPGHYVLPQAFVEDMYRPDRFGRTATARVAVAAAK
jgi:uncharacterized protein YfaS (alpha-2-macroglobulin family)